MKGGWCGWACLVLFVRYLTVVLRSNTVHCYPGHVVVEYEYSTIMYPGDREVQECHCGVSRDFLPTEAQ